MTFKTFSKMMFSIEIEIAIEEFLLYQESCGKDKDKDTLV